MRHPAKASAIQTATARTPSQPISGTGRGKLGIEIIRWSQSTRSTNAWPML